MHIQAGSVGPDDNGYADGAEGHWRGVGDKADAGRVEGVEAEAGQHGGGDGHGRAEAGRAFNERAEGEGHQDGLQTAVVGEGGQRLLDDFELSGFHCHVVNPDRGDHDPDNGEEAEEGAQGRGAQGQGHRHAPDDYGQENGRGGAHQRGFMPGGAFESQHVEKKIQGDGGHQRGNQILGQSRRQFDQRIVSLRPFFHKSPSFGM